MRERLHERWRDKTRDNLTSTLNSLGVRAGIADRGRDEENVGKGMFTRSLGVVEVPEGPIRWINVVKQDGGRHNPPRWWMVFCVPDDERDTTPDDLREVDGRQTIDIKTSREKSFPLFGRVTGITWDGDDRGTRLLDVFAGDAAITSLAKKTPSLEVSGYDKEFQGWTLQVEGRFRLSRQDWEALLRLAGRLLRPRMRTLPERARLNGTREREYSTST